MRAVIQRVAEATVTVESKITGRIAAGLLVFIGIEEQDEQEDMEWLAGKIIGLRIFNDETGVMNKSVQELGGGLLIVSQFTLHASTRKGNRPSYLRAARPGLAIAIYEQFLTVLRKKYEGSIQTGIFGADMKVQLLNDGPVTIIIDTKNRE